MRLAVESSVSADGRRSGSGASKVRAVIRSMPSDALPRQSITKRADVLPWTTRVPSVLTRYRVSRSLTRATSDWRTSGLLASSEEIFFRRGDQASVENLISGDGSLYTAAGSMEKSSDLSSGAAEVCVRAFTTE